MNAIVTVPNSQVADYCHRIAEVGYLKRLARKCAIIEAAIARDLERRRNLGFSPSPLNRAVVVR